MSRGRRGGGGGGGGGCHVGWGGTVALQVYSDNKAKSSILKYSISNSPQASMITRSNICQTKALARMTACQTLQ